MGLRTTFRNLLWRGVGAYPVRIRGERFVCHPRHCSVWRKLAAGKREAGALDILEKLPHDSVVWDIGAHVGLFTLFASRKCERVVCFEPDPVALQYLSWNIARNCADNVTLVGAACAAKTEFRRMGAAGAENLGEGHTGFNPPASARTTVAPCLGPDVWGAWLNTPPDLVKMDIEGGEFELLPAMSDWLEKRRPKMLLSLHAVPLRGTGLMSAAEADAALENCAKVLSFYGEFTELHSGKTFPMSEMPARMSAEGRAWHEGICME